jgi:putative nucleotidyltransferase with HDIG domain
MKMDIMERVVSFLADQNTDAYFVGGLVRDELLGRTVKRDIDLAIDGDAAELARTFADTIGGAFHLMDADNNVARVILSDTYIDFAQLRGDLRQDLGTRDFTINAMARQLGSNELTDPFHGQKHLQAKQICAVSDEAFQNDPVRLLRAVRIAGELGFTIGAHTEKLMRRDGALLAFASMERARDEFCKIIAQPNLLSMLRLLDDLGLLAALLPEVTALKGVEQSAPHVYDAFEHTLRVVDELEKIQTRGYAQVADGEFAPELVAHLAQKVSGDRTRGVLLRLIALLHDIGKPSMRSVDDEGAAHFYEHERRGAEMSDALMRRLRFSNDEIEIALCAIREHMRPLQLSKERRVTNRAIYRYFRDAKPAGVDTCVLSLADQRGKASPKIDKRRDTKMRETLALMLGKYYREPNVVIAPPQLIEGRALMQALNLPPGPRVGELLEVIREAQADGQVTTRDEAIAFARKTLSRKNLTEDGRP